LQTTLRIQNFTASLVSPLTTFQVARRRFDGIDFGPRGRPSPRPQQYQGGQHGPSFLSIRRQRSRRRSITVCPHGTPLASSAPDGQLNWIASLQSGRPIPIVTAKRHQRALLFNQRAQRSSGNRSDCAPTGARLPGYLNLKRVLSARRLALLETWDATPSMGPGYKNLDFSLTKNTQLTEPAGVQLRAESSTSSTIPISRSPTTSLNRERTSGGELHPDA